MTSAGAFNALKRKQEKGGDEKQRKRTKNGKNKDDKTGELKPYSPTLRAAGISPTTIAGQLMQRNTGTIEDVGKGCQQA